MRKCKYSFDGICLNNSIYCASCDGTEEDMEKGCTPLWAIEVDENGNRFPMKQFERVKREIQSVDSGMAMTGFINGIEAAAIVWCKKNAPGELYVSGGATRVSIEGMAAYLDSEV